MIARRWLLSLPFLALAPCLCATPPAPTPAPPEPDVVLPDAPPVPPQPPAPQPAPAITKLSAAELYVIEGKVPLLVLASPEGIVTVTEEAGPLKVRAIFAGNTKFSTRNIKGPSVYFVEAVSTGRVELLIARKDGSGKVIRRTLDVTNGPAPTPPGPDPSPPGPKPPDPTPKPPEPAKTFRVIFVRESGKNLPPELNGVVYGREVEEYLTKNATGGKAGIVRRDPDQPPGPGVMGEIWIAAKAKLKATDPPCVIVEKNEKIEIIPIESSPAAMIAVFDQYLKGAK